MCGRAQDRKDLGKGSFFITLVTTAPPYSSLTLLSEPRAPLSPRPLPIVGSPIVPLDVGVDSDLPGLLAG